MTLTAETLVEEASGIYALPEIYAQLNKKLSDPHASNPQIADVIQLDAGLSSSLLKIVNSAFYGFPSKISTISQAISIIGRTELAELVLGKSVISVFNRLDIKPSELQALWSHSLLCGLLAKQLAKRISDCEAAPDTLFVAGLLHDIGKLVIWHRLPEQSNQLLACDPPNGLAYLDAETNQLGFDHCAVGSQLLQSWKLPSLLVTTTAHHHQPANAPGDQLECSIVSLANQLSHLEKPDEMILIQLATQANEEGLSVDADLLSDIDNISREQMAEMHAMFLGN